MSEKCTVREAVASDMTAVLQLIQELSDVENVSEKSLLTVEDLLYDGGFKANTVKRYTCFVAIERNGDSSSLIGYCLGFFKIFSGERRTLFIDSLYVRLGEYSRATVERMLAVAMLQYARASGCQRLDMHVLRTNPSRDIWIELGAVDLTQTQSLHHLRIHSDALQVLIDM